MYLFLPVINKGIAYLSKYEFRLVVMNKLGIFVLWKDYKTPNNDVFLIDHGSSVMWFEIYYLTGAYIGKYRVDYTGIKRFIYCIITLLIFIFTSYVYFKAYHNELDFFIGKSKIQLSIALKKMLNESNSSSLKIIQSITICLFFYKFLIINISLKLLLF